MGQGYSRLCNGSSSRREPGAGRWKRLKTEGGGKVVRQGSPCSGLVSVQPPQGSSSAVSSTEANDDKRDHDLEEPAGESAWDGEGLEDSEVDKGGETPTYKYISMKSESGKAPKKRKWHGKVSSHTSNASTSVPKEVTPLQPNDIILAGNERSQTGNTFRPGSLPAVITDSKPMKDAHRLLGVLTEHAHADELSEEGPESGDAVHRIIQHDIGRERSINARLRELKDIEGRKSERRLSVTAAATASQLHVIPEIIGEEPTDPADFKYSDTDLYF